MDDFANIGIVPFNQVAAGPTHDVIRAMMIEAVSSSKWPLCPLDTANLDAHAAAAQAVLDDLPNLESCLKEMLLPLHAASENVVFFPRLLPASTAPTPYKAHLQDQTVIGPQLRAMCLAIVAAGGRPYAPLHENDGRPARHVRPAPGDKGERSSHGATADFGCHSDNPADRDGDRPGDTAVLPSHLFFHCQRNFERAATHVVHLDAVLKAYEFELGLEIAPLFEQRFLFIQPESVRLHGGGAEKRCLPILWRGHGAVVHVRWDPGCVEGVDKESHRYVAHFEMAIKQAEARCGRAYVLNEGDFMAFDNRRVLHARKRFAPWSPIAARWLVRMYAHIAD